MDDKYLDLKKENVVDGKVLYTNSDRLDTNNILKFY